MGPIDACLNARLPAIDVPASMARMSATAASASTTMPMSATKSTTPRCACFRATGRRSVSSCHVWFHSELRNGIVVS